MNNETRLKIKPKNPLLAVIFSIILAGLGQIYAGKLKRGTVVFCIPLLYSLIILIQLLTPFMGFKVYVVRHFIVFVIFGVIFAIDSYYCATTYNKKYNLIRKKSYKKDILFTFIILLLIFFCNPFHVFVYTTRFYLAECISIRQDRASLQLKRGDKVVANKFIYKISEPKRNDVGLFRDNNRVFMARIVGLAGDVVEMSPAKILINGSSVKEFEGRSSLDNNLYNKIEVRPNEYFIIADSGSAFSGGKQAIFMPKKYLKGKIYKIYYPISRVGLVK